MSDSLSNIASAVARALGLSSVPEASEETLCLVRAGFELAHRLDARAAHAAETLLEWIRLVDPTAPEDLVATVRDRIGPNGPEWLSVLAEPNRAALLVAPELIVLSLVRLVPSSTTAAREPWRYVDGAATALRVDADVVSHFHGWLNDSADADVRLTTEALLDGLAQRSPAADALARRAREHAASLRETRRSTTTFDEWRRHVQGVLSAAEPHLDALHLERTSREWLRHHLASDRFRLAVLGEFNRGKSTLLNAIVGVPALMRTDILPCTSALTEVVSGPEIRFEVSGGPLSPFEPSTEAEFKRGSAGAAASHSTRETAEAAAAQVPYWRVHLPNPFLADSSVSLVDTPGLGEDYARDRIARSEAERADAAILVFDFNQVASLAELDLIETMKSKAGDLLIVVNKADPHTEPEWPKVRAHIINKVATRTDAIASDRIHFVSAMYAERALRAGRHDDPALARLLNLREQARRHLVERAGPIKLKVARDRVDHFITESIDAVEARVTKQRQQLDDLENLSRAHERTQRYYEMSGTAVRTAASRLRHSDPAANDLVHAFRDALPGLLEAVWERSAEWTSEANPITSPKKHVTELGTKARDALLGAIEQWMKEHGGALLSRKLEAQYDAAERELEPVRIYLKDATGRDPSSIMAELRSQVFTQSLGGSLDGLGDGSDAALRVAAVGVLSAVIGYIIADIILFYVLKIIAGFLNPWLLAAALVTSIAVYAVKGSEWVKGWIRDKVFESMKEKLTGDTHTIDRLERAVRDVVTDIFARVADTFQSSCQDLVNEARYQSEATRRALEAHLAEHGASPEAARAAMAKLEEHAAAARQLLESLRDGSASEVVV